MKTSWKWWQWLWLWLRRDLLVDQCFWFYEAWDSLIAEDWDICYYTCVKKIALSAAHLLLHLLSLHVFLFWKLHFDCMLWITHSLALMDYFSWVFSRFTLDCFLSTSFSLPCLWLDNFSAPSRPLYLPSLSAALQRLPCRSLTQLDQQMHLGILLILSPVFDNYRVWLDWATVLAMKVLVIFKLSFNQLWVGFVRKLRCIWTSWALSMLNTRLIIIYNARWFDFGSALLLPFMKIKPSMLEILNLTLIMYTTSGTRWRTSLVGILRKFGIPMMDGCGGQEGRVQSAGFRTSTPIGPKSFGGRDY